MSGYFVVQRNVFEHVDFAAEPFTEREAWMWLISEAAWKPKLARVGSASGTVKLERGDLAHSQRFLANKWKWSLKKVRCYLDRSEKQGRITRKRAHDGAVISICNYDKYQLSGHTEGQTEGAPRAHQGRKEEEGNKDKTTSTPPGGLIDERTEAIAVELETVLGIDRKFVPPDWCGAPMRISAMLRESIPPEIIILGVRQRSQQIRAKGQSPPTNFAYYERPIAEAFARAQAPVPKAQIIPASTFEVKRAQKLQSVNSVSDAARANRERLLASFARDGPDDPPGG